MSEVGVTGPALLTEEMLERVALALREQHPAYVEVVQRDLGEGTEPKWLLRSALTGAVEHWRGAGREALVEQVQQAITEDWGIDATDENGQDAARLSAEAVVGRLVDP